ncbi:10-hydroxy-9-(phosphonooxy)octadecanoate phosphatase [Aureococcus anophagefferens]|nr:10-hydroxy-9-(phosphonooxy)octadecanoate phosphatase [Aureococcus anophagefferens]
MSLCAVDARRSEQASARWAAAGLPGPPPATAALGGRIADDAAYVAAWATPGNVARCGGAGAADCGWLAGFGAIDVGCTFDVVLGLRANGTSPRPPTLVLTLASGEVVEIAAGDAAAADGSAAASAVRVPKSPPSADVALLSVANSAAYFRLWPLFLSRLLYASDSKLRPLVWIGELPKAVDRGAARVPRERAGAVGAAPDARRSPTRPSDRRAALRKFHYRDAAGTRKVLDVEAAVVVFERPATLGVLGGAVDERRAPADLGIDARTCRARW